jgi:nitrate/nitrite-specific signal transduction histidine kinase
MVARTFKGVTWRLIGIFCLLVAVMAAGWSIPHDIAWGKEASDVAQHALGKFWDIALLYLPPLLTVIGVSNWLPSEFRRRVPALAIAVAAGCAAGMFLDHAVHSLLETSRSLNSEHMMRATTFGSHFVGWLGNYFLAGLAATVYFSVVREDELACALHQEEMGRVGAEREMTEAQLQVMQAQIEPHFLFNTLANVRRLYQTDPATGRCMLQHLSRYLSAALPQMRESRSTLERELALTIAYLNIQKIRMDARLSFEVDVPASLQGCEVPPMMLLTLVENSIRHGLVPLPQGGSVRVTASAERGTLHLRVTDTGQGLRQSSGAGVGLANIRARLKTLYGAAARLSLQQNAPSGVTATLELPEPASA